MVAVVGQRALRHFWKLVLPEFLCSQMGIFAQFHCSWRQGRLNFPVATGKRWVVQNREGMGGLGLACGGVTAADAIASGLLAV